MGSGRKNMVVGQVGEYAVCAALGKRGLIATPFAGNVPGFDVLVVDDQLNCLPIQVKTSSGSQWITGSLRKYVNVTHEGKKIVLGEAMPPKHPRLIRVYVSLGKDGKADRFFVMTEQEFFDAVNAHFREWIESTGGIRPRKPGSLHTVIKLDVFEAFEDRWELVDQQLEALRHP
jgi:hypothetical protein